MKILFPVALTVSVLLFSCRKTAEPATAPENDNAAAPYDTVAIDSFATGANPEFLRQKEDSVRQMFLDSISAVKAKQAELENKDKAKKEAIDNDKKKAEDQKKKPEEKSEKDPEAGKPEQQ